MIKVSAVNSVKEKLRKGQKWITITGNAGDGKTTLGYLVLKEFQGDEKMKVYCIKSPKDYEHLVTIEEDRILLLNDRFGAFAADKSSVEQWLAVIESILTDHEKSHSQVNQTRVIFVSRKNVMKESIKFLERFAKKIFSRECLFDLSGVKLIEERLELLEYYLQKRNVLVDPDVRWRVAAIKTPHGFPHCCKIYADLRSDGHNINIEEFFRSPLDFLDDTTRHLYSSDSKSQSCWELFRLMIKNNGEFDPYSIEDDDKRDALLKVVRKQEGSYINELKDGVYVFTHPSIYESVLSIICETDSLFCLKYANLSVLRQKIELSELEGKSPFMIRVKPVPGALKALARRFEEELLKGDYSVFKHRFCLKRDFCEALVSECLHTTTTQTAEADKKHSMDRPGRLGDTMVWTAWRFGNKTAVCVLVKHGADANIKDKDGLSLLHYHCRDIYEDKESDEDSDADIDNADVKVDDGEVDEDEMDIETFEAIITQGNGDVNIQDEGGRTPLHYLCKHKTIKVNALRWIISIGKSDVNLGDVYGCTPLHYVCRRKHVDAGILRLMVSEGHGDINQPEQNKSTPLHYLCKHTLDTELIQYLVTERNGEFNKGDEHESSALHRLCSNCGVDVGTVLDVVKKAGGDINKRDNNGITPFHILCTRPDADEYIHPLIREGKGDINLADQYGNTPLHYLCRRNQLDVRTFELLLKRIPEADVEKTNNHGFKPLHYLYHQEIPTPLPWTDGILVRSAADLVVCRLNVGESIFTVLGPSMKVLKKKMYIIEGFGRVLAEMPFNKVGSRERFGNYRDFRLTCSSPLPLPNCLSLYPQAALRYWETKTRICWRKEEGFPVLEMALAEKTDSLDTVLDSVDMSSICVSSLPRSWCVSVWNDCPHHPDNLCIQVYRGQRDRANDCVKLCTLTHGAVFYLTFGFVVDLCKGRIGFIDVERGQLLHKFDEQFCHVVLPMFSISKDKHCCDVKTRLVSGRKISITDTKIKLIQEALSN